MHDQRYCVFNKDRLILSKKNNTYQLLGIAEANAMAVMVNYPIATEQAVDYFAAAVAEDAALLPGMELVPLRHAFMLLGEGYVELLSKAYQIIQWDKSHRFCGACGTKTSYRGDKWEKHCPRCAMLFYPRISPAIIVCIKKANAILMARSPHFPPGAYGLIAGFVEPGESVEAAVHREVFEEVGIKINNIRYFASQSWPFPHSLMLGFTADYLAGDLVIDPTEIESAGWYSADNLPGSPTSQFSITYKMIEKFLDQSNP